MIDLRGVKKMKIKNAILASLLFAGIPFAAQAQDAGNVENYENYQVSCETGVDCQNFDVIYEQQEGNDEVSQRTRTRRTRRTSSFSKYYVSGNVGLFFPDGDGADTGFGFGGLFGYRFTEQIAAELEVFDYFGGTEIDDLGYNFLGFAANVAGRYPFNSSNPRSIYGFAGGGIGYGNASSTGDVADAREDAGFDTSEGGFLFQGKLGLGYPVSDNIDILGQFRYVNLSVDGGSGDAFTLDAGVTYNF